MEILLGLFMLAGGLVLAGGVLGAMALLGRSGDGPGERAASAPPPRDSVAASLLFHILISGGVARQEALKTLRRETGFVSLPTQGIDATNWAESYARASTPQQRHELLETAVRLIAAPGRPIPLRQYAALLDLSFGLGFQTDALARLRAVYGFDYVDPARAARPRSADRAGGGAPLFERTGRDDGELRRILGVAPGATRQEIAAAYRKLAAQHHPDRFHGGPPEREEEAANRFIEITRAYEELAGNLPD